MAIDKLVLIDGHALAYRVFFGLKIENFTTKKGEPTNATFGFTRALMDLIFAPDPPKYLAVSFDVGATFRDAMFSEYKGTREKMPDELRIQIERIREVVRAFNIPVMELDGYEADDVLGTIAHQAKRHYIPVHIITGDRDLLQLVDDDTTVELPPGRFQRQPSIFTPKKVKDKYGLEPQQIIDLKALMGDTSDNIPGVKGVGEKTATKLLQEYGTLDAIYENLSAVKTRFRNKLEADKENAYLSYKLAKIVTNAPIELDIQACVAQEFDPAPVLELFQELEFRSLTRRLIELTEGEEPVQPDPTETITIRTQAQLNKLVKELNKANVISFDVETTGIDKMQADMVGICLATKAPTAYYIPVGHVTPDSQTESGQLALFASERRLVEDQLPLETVLNAIRPAMTNPTIPKVAHNAKYDFVMLNRYGLEVTPISFDTMIAEWLTNPLTKFKGLKDLADNRLNIRMTNITDLIGKGKKQRPFSEVEIDLAAPYGAADADMTLRLMPILEEEIKEKKLEELMEMEIKLIPVLSAMEQEGVGVDPNVFDSLSTEMAKRSGELQAEIYDIAGRHFNINSTQQLSDVLFQELGFPSRGVRKLKSGHFSTAADVLDSMRVTEQEEQTGIIERLFEYRELGKLKSTYVDALPKMINPRTSRIHTSFNQTGAVTGRIASDSPNLQNIPIRSEVGRQIRRGFVARPGHLFLAADYSQVELRILAHVSNDKTLKEAFWADQDIHRTTASAVFSKELEDVTFEERRFAKAVNFGLMYGMGAFRLARDSDLTLAEAQNYIDEYFARLPGVRAYLDGTKQQVRDEGWVETLHGRRRYFPIFMGNKQPNQHMAASAERVAINHPIQGTAADIIKLAMIRLHDELTANYQAKMLVQVHDELLLEVPEDEVEAVKPLIIEIMSNAFKLDVPLKVDASTGRNWLELKD